MAWKAQVGAQSCRLFTFAGDEAVAHGVQHIAACEDVALYTKTITNLMTSPVVAFCTSVCGYLPIAINQTYLARLTLWIVSQQVDEGFLG